jgi:hypothetical protein
MAGFLFRVLSGEMDFRILLIRAGMDLPGLFGTIATSASDDPESDQHPGCGMQPAGQGMPVLLIPLLDFCCMASPVISEALGLHFMNRSISF